MAPVIREMEKRGYALNLVLTGQHEVSIAQLISDFALLSPFKTLRSGGEIQGLAQVPGWFLQCLRRAIFNRDSFFPRPAVVGNDILLVHGDTFSTLLGALIGKLLRIPVGHIESGLRSFNLLHPFPEELTRLCVSALSDLAFCPGEWAFNNLRNRKIVRIDTGENTIVDALTYALDTHKARLPVRFEGQYGVCSIHRFENIFFRRTLTSIVELIEEASHRYSLVFVIHPATRVQLAKHRLLCRLEQNTNVQLMPRMGYLDFVALINGAEFVITDGGSNQEELSYLGKPTLLMRKATERQEGLGETVTLCNYDVERLRTFLSGVPHRTLARENRRAVSPSAMIADYLMAYSLQSWVGARK